MKKLLEVNNHFAFIKRLFSSHQFSKQSKIKLKDERAKKVFPIKPTMTRGPQELLLKPISKDHPALHGMRISNKERVNFKSFGFRKDLCDAIKDMGIDEPTPIQVESISKILQGKNILTTSLPGSGKTLAYLLPVIHKLKTEEVEKGITSLPGSPHACIVVPSRELALQVLSVVKHLSHFSKLSSLGLISGRKKKWKLEGLNNSVDVVVCTPHDLLSYLRKDIVSFSHLKHLVIDEADTMFDPSFQTLAMEILRFAGIRPWVNFEQRIQTTFVSATIPHELLKLLQNLIQDLTICNISLHQVLPHVSQKFVKIPQHKKSEQLLEEIRHNLRSGQNQTMVFCNTTKSCDWTSFYLEEQGISQIRLNGKMTKKERKWSIDKFQHNESPILVCTDVASRGLDTTNVGNLSQILHFREQCITTCLYKIPICGKQHTMTPSTNIQQQQKGQGFLIRSNITLFTVKK